MTTIGLDFTTELFCGISSLSDSCVGFMALRLNLECTLLYSRISEGRSFKRCTEQGLTWRFSGSLAGDDRVWACGGGNLTGGIFFLEQGRVV